MSHHELTAGFRWICSARAIFVGLGLASAVGSFSQSTAACDCAFAQVVSPTAMDKSVATNTKIWTNFGGCDQAVVQKQGGMPVAATISRFGSITVIQPNADLEMGSTYEVTNCGGSATVVTTFTVSEGPDTTPPEKPTFTMGETQSSGSSFSSCGEELYVPLEVKYQGTLLILDVAGRSTLDPQTFTGKPVDAFWPGDTAIVGYGACLSNNWDFDKDGDAVNTRLGAFDLAGNFSGMTEPFSVEPSCTCTAVGGLPQGNGYAIAGLALMGIAAIRRKRAGRIG